MLGRKIKIFENVKYSSSAEIIRLFVIEYYQTDIPSGIVVMDEVDDKNPLNHYLRSQSSDSFLSVNVLK